MPAPNAARRVARRPSPTRRFLRPSGHGAMVPGRPPGARAARRHRRGPSWRMRNVHDNRELVEARLRRELVERLRPAIHRARMPLQVQAWSAPGEPVSHDVAVAAAFEPFEVGRPWGRPWGTTWFRLTGTVPEEWERWAGQVEAVIDLGFRGADAGFQAEGLVWARGRPLQGVHPRRTAVPLPTAVPGETIELLVEAAANPAFPDFRPSQMGAWDTAPDRPLYRLTAADLAVLDREVFDLVLDIEVLA